MAYKCSICDHPDRADIENALLAMSSEGPGSIEEVANRFDVSVDDLKMHAVFHTPLVEDSENASTAKDSLTRKMKLREADILASVSNEYLVTLRTMGRRINKLVQVDPIDAEDEGKQLKLAKMLTKPMVDLYIGLGGEIRQTVKTMAELDRLLNGPEDAGTSGLAALAKVLGGGADTNG